MFLLILIKKLEAEDLILINFKHTNGLLSSFKATTRANNNYRSAIDVIGDKGRIIVKGVSLNTFSKFKNDNLVLNKKFSENFEKIKELKEEWDLVIKKF